LKATTEIGYAKRASSLLVLALACLPRVAPALAQVNPRIIPPIVVDAKKASHLLLVQSRPEYPALAKVNYIQGRVQLEVEVKSNGKVEHAHVLTGHPVLAASSLKAIHDWTYRPLLTSSGPSGFLTIVTMNFSLRFKLQDLRPSQAERDLARQVKPPVVAGRPAETSTGTFVQLRLLVDDHGEVIDSGPAPNVTRDIGPAQKNLQSWTFRPAHWGTLPIAWYIDVNVPVTPATIPQTTTARLVNH
jgi:TonB family protein